MGREVDLSAEVRAGAALTPGAPGSSVRKNALWADPCLPPVSAHSHRLHVA